MTPDHDDIPPVTTLEAPEVACEGLPGADAHPLVFLTFENGPEIECPYCGRRFRRDC